jgi:hypothetical protein
VDLDGVLVNFEKFARVTIGITPVDPETGANRKKEFWKAVDKWTRDGNQFFKAMEPLDDASILWKALIQFTTPTILSATGHVQNAAVEKREWVKDFCGAGFASNALFVRDGKDKAAHAAPNHILIDDRSIAIDPWVAAGGIGILHTSALDTLLKLEAILSCRIPHL